MPPRLSTAETQLLNTLLKLARAAGDIKEDPELTTFCHASLDPQAGAHGKHRGDTQWNEPTLELAGESERAC